MRRLVLLGGVLLAGSLMCRADVITTFDIHGAIGNGFDATNAAGTVTGTVTIDTTTGVVTGLDAMAATTSANNLGVTSATFTFIATQGMENNPFVGSPVAFFYEVTGQEAGYGLQLDFASPSLVGFNGGDLCSYSYQAGLCTEIESDYQTPSSGVALVSLSLTPETAATPEPSSLALLGSGALGVVGLLRRKKCC